MIERERLTCGRWLQIFKRANWRKFIVVERDCRRRMNEVGHSQQQQQQRQHQHQLANKNHHLLARHGHELTRELGAVSRAACYARVVAMCPRHRRRATSQTGIGALRKQKRARARAATFSSKSLASERARGRQIELDWIESDQSGLDRIRSDSIRLD